MPCYTPLTAYRVRHEIGSRIEYDIIFTANHPQQTAVLQLPCGQCIGCRLERSRQWAVRCVHEAQLHEQNCFLTLTFNDEHLNHNLSLHKPDFQNFMKRLRKKYPKNKYGRISYFHCGEYGENYSRPHHHACIFGFDFPDKKPWRKQNENTLYTSEILNELWPFGFCTIGQVNFETAAYVARYVTKKITGKNADQFYSGRQPEYTTMSKRPAIGLKWIEKYISDVYPHDEVILNGQKMRPSRFYDKYLEKNHPEQYTDIKISRESAQLTNPDSTRERLNVKHEIKLLKSNQLKRSYEFNDQFELKSTLQKDTFDHKILDYYKQQLVNRDK